MIYEVMGYGLWIMGYGLWIMILSGTKFRSAEELKQNNMMHAEGEFPELLTVLRI